MGGDLRISVHSVTGRVAQDERSGLVLYFRLSPVPAARGRAGGAGCPQTVQQTK